MSCRPRPRSNRPLSWRAVSTALLLGAMIVAGVVAACNSPTRVRFPHELHLAGLNCGTKEQPECLSCASCHDPKRESAGFALPELSTCTKCHQQSETAKLATLRPPPPAPVALAQAIRFSHEQHLGMNEVKGQCVPCHSLGTALQRASPSFPAMSTCLSCHYHQKEFDAPRCVNCHAQADLPKLKPETFLRHDIGFARHHGAQARMHEKTCAECHAQQQCDDCHNADSPLSFAVRNPERASLDSIHPPGFATHHSVDARAEPARCLTCHSVPSCDACHVRNGVSGNAFEGRNPHPPQWVSASPAGANSHGRAARRDIVACAACHDQGPATNCIRCHQVGGFGGNPHPRGWQSARSANDSMCRYCHVP